MNQYRVKTTEELIKAYEFEKSRIDEKDRKTAQKLIIAELQRRFNATINLLDSDQSAEGTYRYLLNI